jgi:hypothetical protein
MSATAYRAGTIKRERRSRDCITQLTGKILDVLRIDHRSRSFTSITA